MCDHSRTHRSASDGISSLRIDHDHILPPRWHCRYDPQTKRYYFIYDEEESESSEESEELEEEEEEEKKEERKEEQQRIVSKEVEYQYGSSPLRKERIRATPFEANVDRICSQFPNVEKAYINHLVKMYNYRENLVISALLAESHTRQTFTLDESLFYKLKQSFPHVEPDNIRRLLVQNGNKEHPTIAALLNIFGLFNTVRYKHSKRPQLKLKYLKFAFPEIDEIELLDLLYKYEFNVGQVIKNLKTKGYDCSKDIQIKMSKVSETALLKDASDRLQAPRPRKLFLQAKHIPNLWEQQNIIKNLIELYPSVNVFLINWALESTKFNVELAKTFLEAMTPQESEKYLVRTLPDKPIPLIKILISRQIQTNQISQDFFGKFSLVEIGSDDNLDVEKCDKSTWTNEDEIYHKTITKLAIGPDKENRKGPNVANRIYKLHEKIGPMIFRKGPNVHNRKGPDTDRKDISIKVKKQGPIKDNRKGALGKQIVKIKEVKVDEFSEPLDCRYDYYYW